MSRPDDGAAPPRVVVWVALVVCVGSAVMVLLGGWRVGVWTDEPAHVMRYENLQEHGWYLLDDDFDGDEPGSWVTDRYVYAPVATQVMHGVNRVVGLDPAGGLGTSVRAYGVRHLVVGVLGLLGVLAVVVIGRRLLGSWSWGLVAGATLMAIPMWPGLSMFDIKDVPAATGYTLVTLGLVELLSRQRPGPGWLAWPVAALAAGLVLAIGTRPGLWPGLAAGIAIALVLSWTTSGDRPGAWLRRVVVPIAVAGALAYAVLLLAYPAYFTRPHEWLVGSVGGSAHYTGSPQAPPEGSYTYLPSRVVAVVMPPALLLLGVAGLLASLSRRLPRLTPQLAGWLVVASQALVLPVLAVIGQSPLSDNLRQALFACPAVALLLVRGWQHVVTNAGKESKRARGVLGLVLSAAVLVPVAVQLQMFPYGYSYAAPQATSLGAAPEDDWARLSLRELLPQVPRGEFLVCRPRTSELGNTRRWGTDCRTDPLSSLAPYELAAGKEEEAFVANTFLAVYTRGVEPGRNCTELGRVERWRYFSRAVMSRVARCELVLDPYPETGVLLSTGGAASEFLLGGWTSHPAEPGVRVRGPSGSLGFELPESWTTGPLRVRLDGETAGMPQLWVNNRPVAARPDGEGWAAEVPASTVAAMGERRLVITLAPGQPRDELVLTSVLVDPT